MDWVSDEWEKEPCPHLTQSSPHSVLTSLSPHLTQSSKHPIFTSNSPHLTQSSLPLVSTSLSFHLTQSSSFSSLLISTQAPRSGQTWNEMAHEIVRSFYTKRSGRSGLRNNWACGCVGTE
ncbi:hypothetical protein Pcinc_030069 [Petrolisthes cinctipes]|uniref:Uncharacterized protein n=1 Tax=Petrolisthes cinctipes TaxID=88211 RepID=A0AAE1EZK7_PETCI|nr:hypothetical protein Pcinc_030069 [Petrolisthes cinctipes]